MQAGVPRHTCIHPGLKMGDTRLCLSRFTMHFALAWQQVRLAGGMVKDPITYKPQIQAREGGKMVTDHLRRLQANTCPEAWSHLGQPKAILIHEATCPTQPQATTLDRLRSIHAYHLLGGLPSLSVRL